MLYFETRKLARQFSTKKENYKVVDYGTDRDVGSRWGVKVL